MSKRRIVTPAERPVLWRKIMVRLGALGLDTSYLCEAVYGEEVKRGERSRHYAMVNMRRKAMGTLRMTVNERRQFEAALALPVGALVDAVPLEVVAVMPVPPSHEASVGLGPCDDDCIETGVAAPAPTSAWEPVAKAVKAASVRAARTVLAPLVPTLELPEEFVGEEVEP